MSQPEHSKCASTGGLSGIRIIDGVPPSAREAIERRCAWRRYLPGQTIVGFQDDSRDVFFVAAGSVRVVLYSSSGREVTFRDISAGDAFGEYAAIDEQPRSANVVALEEAVIASLPASTFREVLLAHPEAAMNTLKSLTYQLRRMTERVFEFSALAVNNRIHAELLRLARPDDAGDGAGVIDPAPKHADIASRISTHREAVTRELNRLERLGLIQRGGHAVRITDLARLRRLVREGEAG